MTIIAVMNPKGGVSKTTTTVTLASFLSQTYQVAVIDTDTQASVKTYVGEQDKFKLYHATQPTHVSALPKNPKARAFDFIFIDTPANIGKANLAAVVAVSDFVIVPTKASRLDIEPTLRFVDSVLVPNQKPFKLLLTQIIPSSNQAETTLSDLEDNSVPTFITHIRQYQSYLQASQEQKSIFEMGHSASYARNDYSRVAHELLGTLRSLQEESSQQEQMSA